MRSDFGILQKTKSFFPPSFEAHHKPTVGAFDSQIEALTSTAVRIYDLKFN
uniref:Uncharacterized protein n=1 Tax=Romanomermis culicivorax TaxID=13658 RepID=A0A915JK50_ROMCU